MRINEMPAIQREERTSPTLERMARGEIVAVEVMPEGTMTWGANSVGDIAWRDRKATLLDRYWRDQLLCPEGSYDRASARHEAGQKLQELYEDTGARRRPIGSYAPRSAAYGEMTDDQAEAFEAYQVVVSKMQCVSFGAASAVVNLCIHEFDPVDRRELVRGLDVLVRHWGL